MRRQSNIDEQVGLKSNWRHSVILSEICGGVAQSTEFVPPGNPTGSVRNKESDESMICILAMLLSMVTHGTCVVPVMSGHMTANSRVVVLPPAHTPPAPARKR